MNDTIYRGMRDLVYVALGKTAYSNSSEYLELKKHFRYPGEVLERMEQYGYCHGGRTVDEGDSVSKADGRDVRRNPVGRLCKKDKGKSRR